jgi:hypothetical protein
MAQGMNAALGAALLALALAGCGGGGGGDSDPVLGDPGGNPGGNPGGDPGGNPGGDPGSDPGQPANKFARSASWTFTLPAADASVCYDFDRAVEVPDCSGNAWDLRVKSGGRSATLWTNSGISGSGQGGAFGGPFDRSWTELRTWNDATVDPVDGAMPAAVYFQDAASGVFTGTNPIGVAAFEYDLNGQHQFHPNYRVFLITSNSDNVDPVGTSDAPVFALQIIGYYGGPTGRQSGFPTFRWVDRSAPAVVHTDTVDASDNDAWVHYNLVDRSVVDESGNWHIAFNRYKVKLNGGESGPGKVAGFVGKTPEGLYSDTGTVNVDAFLTATPATTLPALTAPDMAVPTRAAAWVKDSSDSALNADYRGTYPEALDFGWYRYFPTAAAAAAAGLQPPTAHLLAARPEGAALLRSGEGDSYARFHVTDIRYADPSNSSSAQTWTIEFDVQPRP